VTRDEAAPSNHTQQHGRLSATPTGTGPDVVLLHSLLTDRGVWDRVVPTLAEQRRVWAVDLPGWGDSDTAPPDIGVFAARVAAFLEQGGLEKKTAVVGNGLGAMVALALAARHGARFGRLVLVGAAAWFPADAARAFATMAERVRKDGMAAVVDIAVARIFPDDYLRAHPDIREERRRVLLRTDPAAFITACTALGHLDLRDDLATISNATLIVVGDRDQATPPARARELADRIPAAQLTTLPDCAHAPQLQHPQAFLQAVGPFLGLDGAKP